MGATVQFAAHSFEKARSVAEHVRHASNLVLVVPADGMDHEFGSVHGGSPLVSQQELFGAVHGWLGRAGRSPP